MEVEDALATPMRFTTLWSSGSAAEVEAAESVLQSLATP